MSRKWLGTFLQNMSPRTCQLPGLCFNLSATTARRQPRGRAAGSAASRGCPFEDECNACSARGNTPFIHPACTWQHCSVGQGFLREFPPDWPALPQVTVQSYAVPSTRSTRSLPPSPCRWHIRCEWWAHNLLLPSSDSDWGVHLSSHTHLLCSCCEIWPLGCSPLSPIFWARRCDWYLTLQRGQAIEEPEIHHSLNWAGRTGLDQMSGLICLFGCRDLCKWQMGSPLLCKETVFFTEGRMFPFIKHFPP